MSDANAAQEGCMEVNVATTRRPGIRLRRWLRRGAEIWQSNPVIFGGVDTHG